jgi:hypothetical protein
MSSPAYTHNVERFQSFQQLQGRMVAALARHPARIQSWLEAQPPRETEMAESGAASRRWRTARLSAMRRRELAQLLARAADPGAGPDPLAEWLLASVPVCTYLEMADRSPPGLAALDPEAADCGRALIQLREALFLANYGLAKAAAHHRCFHDYNDRLSAASCGLLDAIDRYLPGPRAARFGYFATYWIRYRLGRHAQKHSSIVSFPINQFRISRRIDRLMAERQERGQPAPSEREIRAELNLGADAYYWHQRRPRIVSLQRPVGAEGEGFTLEHTLRDPAPEPAALLDDGDLAAQFRALLRAHVTPAARVILAYTGAIGSLAEAAEDYLAHQAERGQERLRVRRFAVRPAAPAEIRRS